MRKVTATASVLAIALVLLSAGPPLAQTEYKEYRRPVTLESYFTISGDNKGNIQIFGTDKAVCASFQVSLRGDSVDVASPAPGVTIWDDSLRAGEHTFSFGEIVDLDVNRRGDTTVVEFFTSPDTTRARLRLKQGSIIRGRGPVEIATGQFVRGHVVCLGGNILVHGEVNKDAVTMLGSAEVAADGVVRGAVVSLTRAIVVRKQATV